MLRPYRLDPCSRLEPFSQTEPHHPVLLWPVERAHNIHLTDCVSQQVHPERESRAAYELARAVGTVPPEQLRAVRGSPRDARVIEDPRFHREDAVIAAALAQQAAQEAEGREPQLGAADDDPTAPELIEHGAGRGRGCVYAFAGVEAVVIIATHQARVANEQRIQSLVLRVPTVAADVEHACGDCEGPRRHHVFAIIRECGSEPQVAGGLIDFEAPAVAEN